MYKKCWELIQGAVEVTVVFRGVNYAVTVNSHPGATHKDCQIKKWKEEG